MRKNVSYFLTLQATLMEQLQVNHSLTQHVSVQWMEIMDFVETLLEHQNIKRTCLH
jgi:hypothetical protein